jgi:site-specific DNA-methyltransferase (adenine-specific)
VNEAASFLDGRVWLEPGDCLEVLRAYPDAHFDAVVTDPPYALVSIAKRFGKPGAAPVKDVYARAAGGFMGKAWDTGERAFAVEFWAEVLRVLKPGGHVAAFAGTRTYHRLACAIEDAGFEIRDQLAWMYGSGFPKSHDQGNGWGTALKPAWEPIALARKPLIETVAATVLAHGTGAINVDGCRVGDAVRVAAFTSLAPCAGNALGAAGTAEARRGTQQPPKTYVGRWPANVVHDGSDEVVAAFPETGATPGSYEAAPGGKTVNIYGKGWDPGHTLRTGHASPAGSAARFFYAAKAGPDDRIGSKHPTVKPVALMRWLCRLITPAGGLILDPFAGTGTTGQAAFYEGFSAVLIEREAEYRADIARRMALTLAGAGERRCEIAKARGDAVSVLPLFGEVAS